MVAAKAVPDDRCLCCGYPKNEEGCQTYLITSSYPKSDYVVILCGREGLQLYKRAGG